MPLVHCSTQPAAPLGKTLSSFPLTAAPGGIAFSHRLLPSCAKLVSSA